MLQFVSSKLTSHLKNLVYHESIPWAMAGVAQTISANPVSLAISCGRFAGALFLRHKQLASGGAQHSKVSPHLIDTTYCATQSAGGFLELGGVLPTKTSAAESDFRAWAYLWCAGFLGSLFIYDTKFGKKLATKKSKALNFLTSGTVWQAPQSWYTFSFAMAPLAEKLGNFPGTHISNFHLGLGVICGGILAQGIIRAIKPVKGMLVNNFGLITALCLNAVAIPVIAMNGNTSWGFFASQFLSIAGGVVCLWRNRNPELKQ